MHLRTRRETLPATRLPLLIVTLAFATGCSGAASEQGGQDAGASNVGSAVGGRGDPGGALGGRAMDAGGAGTTSSHGTRADGGNSGAESQRSGGTSSRQNLGGASTVVGSSGSRAVTGGSSATGGRTERDNTRPGATGGKSVIDATTTAGGASLAGASHSAGGSRPIDTGSASGGTSSSTGGAGDPDLLVPETGALLGLYYGDASIAATNTKLGCKVPLHLTYYAWEDDWTRGNTLEDLRNGRIPFVNWELFGAVLDDIIAGKDDAMIEQRAIAARDLGQKLFIDFGAEMNGDWSPWSGAENGKSSDKYVAAYRHVHDLFVENGASNVIWAFCPNVTSSPAESWNEPLDYYPGDSYVDWMCVDGYNWGKSESWGEWQSFHEVFEKIYPVLASKQKPIIIGEMASTELGGDKAQWISQIIPTLKTNFPLIKGLIWFDIDKETDWRISSSAASEAAFKAMANDPWFLRQ